MRRSFRVAVTLLGALVAILLFAASDGPLAFNQDRDGPNDRDIPITGPALEQASAAALAYLGEGRVTETEIEDEESYYEVEVTLDNGSQIDVQLDEAFNVVGTEHDNGSD